MLNLNYGYIKPTEGDESLDQWMVYLADNWERISDHSHDGDDSSLIQSSSLDKHQTDIISGRIAASGLTYNANDSVIDILTAGATAGMYVAGDQVNFETYITGVTGTSISLSQAVTASAAASGELQISRWERKSSSVYEALFTLPTGYPSLTSNYNFFIATPGDTYENYQTWPTVIVNDVNSVRIQVNKNSYDLKVVVL